MQKKEIIDFCERIPDTVSFVMSGKVFLVSLNISKTKKTLIGAGLKFQTVTPTSVSIDFEENGK